MKTYEVDKSMDAESAQQNLQKAIDALRSIYELIGIMPYSTISNNSDWLRLARKYDEGDRLMEELAADPIPF